MQKLILSIGLLLFAVSTKAQVDVAIHMTQNLGDQPFVYNTAVQLDAGYFIKVNRLQYYISEVKLIHDGGQVTPVTDVYFLVAPTRDSIFELGNFDITDLEQIQFSLGVDPAHNHLDPAGYDASHPLAPKNPSMHWGWTAGYRFIAFEGYSGATASPLPDNYQLHTVDDSNYKTVTLDATGILDTGHLSIPIKADYTRLLDNINVQGGLILHGSTGFAKKLMENLQTLVFTTPFTSGSIAPGIQVSFQVTPNPSSGNLVLHYDFSSYDKLQLTITDLTGKVILKQSLASATADIPLQIQVAPGMYIALVQSHGKLLAYEKVVIRE